MSKPVWEWDETLYGGSAAYYAQGRSAYPTAMADALAQELALDGRGRLLDVGCGPGSVALVLAALFERVVGIDADGDMTRRRGGKRSDWECNADWIAMRAEDITPALGAFRVVTFAQSFHWMDQPRVASEAWAVLEPGGAWVHVNATTHRGVETPAAAVAAAPARPDPRARQYLSGAVRRPAKVTFQLVRKAERRT